MVTIMLVSDIHYEHATFHGVDESMAWQWLLEAVEYHRPELLLSAGDLGTAVTRRDIEELTGITTFITIYGNHDNIEALRRARNRSGQRVLLRDGEIREVQGLRVAGINGIVATKRLVKHGVPRKRPGQYINAALQLRGKHIDILLMHETPYLPGLFPMNKTVGNMTALEAVRIVRPRIVLNGHMHMGNYRVYRFEWGYYLYVDSSLPSRHYYVMRWEENQVTLEVWRDRRPVRTGIRLQ